MHLQPGAMIGEYRIDGFIGEGGMGQVYRAVHTRIGRTVAIKFLPQTSRESVTVQRFLNEARIQASLRHPGVAALYDFMEFQGSSAIIMEYVDGETVQAITSRDGPWTADRALPVLRSCAATMAYVHAQGVVHRDLKSANVKVAPNGETKLLDFGIATAERATRLTTAGFVIGTFQSLSPEQARGEAATPACDIWAFGVLAYEMVTASLPFEGSNQMELFSKILKGNFTPPTILKPSVPVELEEVIARCLRKNPADRYPSMEAVLRDLERISPGVEGIAPRRPPIPRKVLIGAGAFLLILLCTFFLAHILGSSPAQKTMPSSGIVAPAGTQPQSADSGSTDSGSTDSGEADSGASQDVKQVTVDVPDGTAEVWENGKMVGRTPYVITKSYGDSVQLLLRQSGYQDLPVQFDITQRSEYIYPMQRSEPQQ